MKILWGYPIAYLIILVVLRFLFTEVFYVLAIGVGIVTAIWHEVDRAYRKPDPSKQPPNNQHRRIIADREAPL